MAKPLSALLMVFLFFMLLINNAKSDSFSFSFSNFGSEQGINLGFLGDARPLGGIIQLTRRDGTTLLPHSVGRAVYIPPVRLWDKTTGKIADFNTEFTFVVDSPSADGFSFFIIPYDADPRIPNNSSGGYLGLFSPETAFNSSSRNQIVAVEFDSFVNEWENNSGPHIGIDINSLTSLKTAEWPVHSVPEGSVGKALIRYDSAVKELVVVVGYVNESNRLTSLIQTVDLRGILPEWVRIGFSGSTGDWVETHDILSWSFRSSI